MRLLIVSGIFHPEIGGPASYLHDLAHALSEAGHDVAVVAYGSADRAPCCPFPVHRVSRGGSALSRLVRYVRVLASVCRGYPVWFVNDYGVPALAVGVVRRPAIVMKIVGDFAWELARRRGWTADGIGQFQRRRYGWRIEGARRLQRLYARRAARVIVPSQYLARLVRGWGVKPDRIAVIHNAVGASGESTLPQNLATVPRPPVVATVARLAPWKGVDHVLRAFARVTDADAQLIVAGDGPVRPALEALASELGLGTRVRWLGAVGRDATLSLLRRARVCVLLSEYEGLSHVLLEALGVGTPVIASNAGGNPEVVRDGVDGFLVDPLAHAGIAATMTRLLVDDPYFETWSAAARARSDDFRWDRLFRDTVSIIDAVGRPGSPGSAPG